MRSKLNLIIWLGVTFSSAVQATGTPSRGHGDCANAEAILSLTLDDLPKISDVAIKDRVRLDHGNGPLGIEQRDSTWGLGFHYLERGVWEGKNVFIKYPDRKNYIDQIRRYKLFGSHITGPGSKTLGPRFFGLTRDAEGRLGIVMDHIEGVHFGVLTQEIPRDIFITMETYRQVELAEKALAEMGFNHGHDVQFRITSDGQAYLIDPEYLDRAPRPKNSRPGQIAKDFQEIKLTLQSMLKQRGLWVTKSPN